jgi:hypothetical protein
MDMRFKRMMDHLKKIHTLTEESYLASYPGALVRVAGTAQKREKTVRSRYGVENVFQAQEVKQTIRDSMIANHGAPSPLQVPAIRAKVAATNFARLGVGNPFASPEVQAKIRETNLVRFGVRNPNQSPEVMARRIETNLERYGTDHFFERPEFHDEYKAISQERFGANHPMQSEEGRKLCFASIQRGYGVDSVFQLPEVQERAYASNLANHGGQHSQTCPEILARARETWLEKYGTDNPSKVESVKQKIRDVWMAKYGVPFPPQSLWQGKSHPSPNGLERKVQGLSPSCVLYTGSGSYPVRHPKTSRLRFPDFIVLTPDQLEAHQNNGVALKEFRTPAVIEAFGDWWHGPEKTGKSREAHLDEVRIFYLACGIRCLIVWENDVNKRPQAVGERIHRFLIDTTLGG